MEGRRRDHSSVLGLGDISVHIENLIKTTSPIPRKLYICKALLINSRELTDNLFPIKPIHLYQLSANALKPEHAWYV